MDGEDDGDDFCRLLLGVAVVILMIFSSPCRVGQSIRMPALRSAGEARLSLPVSALGALGHPSPRMTTRRIVDEVVELDGRAVARLLPDLRSWLRQNLTNEIADIEEPIAWLERQVEYLEESGGGESEGRRPQYPALDGAVANTKPVPPPGERGNRPDARALAGMARITACGRRCVISTP